MSEEAKKLTAKKEADEAKRAEIEAGIAAKEAANAEVNAKLGSMGEAVTAKEKEVNTYHYETLVQQIKAMKGLMEVAAEDGEEVAARLLQKQIGVAEQAAAGLAAKDGIEFGEIAAERPAKPAAETVEIVKLPELPERSISQEEAQDLCDMYEASKSDLEKGIEEAVAAEDFGLCTKINAQIKALTEQRRMAGAVLKAAGVEVAELPDEPAAEPAAEEAAPAEAEADAEAPAVEEPAAEPEAPMTAEDAQAVVDKVAEVEAALEKAIEDEDFGACGSLNAELEELAPKKVEAEARLKA